jgi:hypothetical protein
MSNRSDEIKPSHIAAARLKVAIAKRRGEKVPAWIRELADLDIPSSLARHGQSQGRASSASPAPRLPQDGSGEMRPSDSARLLREYAEARAALERDRAAYERARALHQQAADWDYEPLRHGVPARQQEDVEEARRAAPREPTVDTPDEAAAPIRHGVPARQQEDVEEARRAAPREPTVDTPDEAAAPTSPSSGQRNISVRRRSRRSRGSEVATPDGPMSTPSHDEPEVDTPDKAAALTTPSRDRRNISDRRARRRQDHEPESPRQVDPPNKGGSPPSPGSR